MASAPGGATKRLAAIVLSEGLLGDDSVPMAISLLRMSKRRRLAAAEDEGEEERRSSTLVLAMVAAFVLSGRTYAARYGTYVRYYALRNHMAPDLWARFFRFTKDQFDRLYACCRFPPSYFITAASGHVCYAPLALLMVLARLSHPRLLEADMVFLFRVGGSRISRFVNVMCHILHEHFKHLLRFNKPRLRANLRRYSDAVGRALGLEEDEVDGCRCWGFIDGTFRYVCRPAERQGVLYNGHYGGYGFKFLILVSACGLIEWVSGPIAGRHHDGWLVSNSDLLAEMATFSYRMEGGARVPYFVYGDAAFARNQYLQKPIVSAVLTPEERDANARWSSVRVSVEHAIGGVTNTWQALEFLRQEKIGLSPVGTEYKVAVLLYNALNCVRGGSQVSRYFLVPPPTLEEWLRPAGV